MGNQSKTRRPLLSIIILFIVFLGPMVIAWYMVAHKETLSDNTTNYGQLIQPPLKLSQLPLYTENGQPFSKKDLQGKWLMLYVSPHRCDKLCTTNLYNMRQIRTAQGKEMERVQRAILTFKNVKQPQSLNEQLKKEYAGTFHFITSKNQFSEFAARLPSTKLALEQGYLYLVDPDGNVMIGYPAQADPDGVYKDLKKLLKYSQIG